ncbi:5-bromo-4-chloroindolyl phosphate hydrolysis family protein [Roseburia hominis]
MGSQDFEHFGEEIRRTVQDAVDSRNFASLNQTITNTINQAMNSAARTIDRTAKNVDRFVNYGQNAGRNRNNERYGGPYGNFGQYNGESSHGEYRQGTGQQGTDRRGTAQNGTHFGGGMNGASSGAYWEEAAKRTQTYRASQKKNPLYEPGTAVKAGGLILAIAGYGIGGGLLLGLISVLAYFGAAHEFSSIAFQVSSSILGVLTAGCAAMAVTGTSMLKRIGRFRSYVRELNGREFCNIKELADKQKKSTKFIVKDLQKMIGKGWFRQGHLDRQNTCLMVTNQAYDQYLQLEDQMEQKKKEEELRRENEQKAAAEKEKNGSASRLSPEVQKIIEQGDLYVEKIRKCNDAIPGKEISDKISHMEMLVDRIFDRVEQSPESVTDIHRLMDYYLPTTIKLLEAYEDLDAQPVGGENIQNSKKEIEATLDTLNMAFEKLLDDLFQDTAWDLSSDISVLHTMLAQEGLMEDGLKK